MTPLVAVPILAMLAAGAMMPAQTFADADYERSLSALSDRLLTAAGKRRVTRIAVADFTDLEGRVSPLGRFLSEELAASLPASGAVQVMDRAQLTALLTRHSLPDLSALDPAALQKLGKLAGLDAIVTGSAIELSGGVRMTVKLIATATGTVVGSARGTMPKTGAMADFLKKDIPAEQPKVPVPAARETPSRPEPEGPPEGMVLVPAGPFLYGGEGEPQRQVSLGGFWIDLFEVTNVEYNKLRDHPYPLDKADHPVINVNWTQARLYCEARGKRLPTEQEWEKAARGTDGRPYPWGATYDQTLLNADNRTRDTTPVGQFPEGRSPYGALDMLGNVWEWTSTEDDRAKVLRGGSWASPAGEIRTTIRNKMAPGFYLFDLGFRCAKDLTKP
jgi:formylglycine-generating enzyme required for sulfatase activity